MNIMVYELASRELKSNDCSQKLKIEDNVGESVHIHVRNTRLELSTQDFETLAQELIAAKEVVEDGHY